MKPNPRIAPIERATQRSWDDWLKFMEGIDGKNLDHHAIATKLLEELDGKIDNIGWWAQSITTAYEQEIGRRIPGQRPDGTFQTSTSKSTKLAMQALMNQWEAFAAHDQDVQALITSEVRVSGTDNRITWRAKGHDGSSITVISEPKKNGTASIVAQHIELPSLEANLEAKETWASILERFLASL